MAKHRLTLPVAALMFGSAQLLLTGCSDSAADRRADADVALDEAVATLERASEGYIPEEAMQSMSVEEQASYNRVLEQYQQNQLDASAEQLAKVIEAGSPAAKVGAYRLRADIYASKARFLTREAMTAWADLAARSAGLISQAVLVSQAEARGNQFTRDESYLRDKLIDQRVALQEGQDVQLGGGESERREGVNELQQMAQERQAEIDRLQAEIDQYEAAQAEATAKAEQHSSNAFTQTGQEQHESALAGLAAGRVAAQNAAEAEKRSVLLDVEKSRLSVINEQLRLNREGLDAIEQSLASVQQRETQRQDRLTAAQKQQEASADALRRMFQEINAGQTQQVGRPLQQAVDLFQQAIDDLQKAESLAQSQSLERAVRFDLLSARMGKIRTMYQYVLAMGGFGETMQNIVAIHDTIRKSPDIEMYRDTAATLETRQTSLMEDTQAEVDQAIALAQELQSEITTDTLRGRAVNVGLARLQLYPERLAAAKIGSDLKFPEEPELASPVAPGLGTGGAQEPLFGGGSDGGGFVTPQSESPARGGGLGTQATPPAQDGSTTPAPEDGDATPAPQGGLGNPPAPAPDQGTTPAPAQGGGLGGGESDTPQPANPFIAE